MTKVRKQINSSALYILSSLPQRAFATRLTKPVTLPGHEESSKSPRERLINSRQYNEPSPQVAEHDKLD
jgi:hypothetical protein